MLNFTCMVEINILVFANILNTFFSFFPTFLLVNMPSIIDFTHLSRTGVVIHKVSKIRELPNKVIHKNYVFFVTSRNRTFRFGRNKELVLTNKQKQF